MSIHILNRDSSKLFYTILSVVCCLISTSSAQIYTNIINVPPDESPESIDSDTQLNLSGGGSLPVYFDAGSSDGTSTNVEVNIDGGTVGAVFDAYAGSTINISGGAIDPVFTAHQGSAINLSGGVLGERSTAESGSVVNFTGGRIGYQFRALEGSQLNITGGEFLLNGVPVLGLTSTGDSKSLNIPEGGILTGTLTDGSVLVFDTSISAIEVIADGTLTLTLASLPTITPVIVAPTDPVPNGLRSGQTLTLNIGASVGDHFAATNAVLNIDGGDVGIGLEVVDSTVNMTSGSVGRYFRALGNSTVNITGGSVASNLQARDNSIINISGDTTVDTAGASSGTTINLDSGTVNVLSASDSGTINMHGGLLHMFMSLGANADANLFGGEFYLDGVPITGLDSPGDTAQVQVPAGSILSGTLSDGTVIVLTDVKRNPNYGDRISNSTISLHATAIPSVSSAINVPTDPAPDQLRKGQTLTLSAGGTLPDWFIATNAVMTLDGGTVGDYMEIVNSTLALNGADIGDYLEVKANSTVYVHDGSIGDRLSIDTGSTMYVTGGSIGDYIRVGFSSSSYPNPGTTSPGHLIISGGNIGHGINVYPQSTMTMTGGSVDYGLDAQAGSTVLIEGGTLSGGIDAHPGSSVTVSGGTLEGLIDVWENSDVTLSGGRINGVDVLENAELKIQGGEFTYIYVRQNATLDLSDGIVSGYQSVITESGGTANISGGKVVGTTRVESDATLNLSGGELGVISANQNSTVALTGQAFILNGVDLRPQLTMGEPFIIYDRDVTLEGLLADGSAFSFDLDSSPAFPFFFFESFPQNMLLTVTLVPIPGDLNSDGFVGLDDLMAVLQHWLQDVTPGDLMMGDPSGDGYVFLEDLDTVLINWNKGIPPTINGNNAKSVPEPTALAVVGIGLAALLRRRN